MAHCSDVQNDLLLLHLWITLVEEEELLLLSMLKRKRKHETWTRIWIREKEDHECNTAYKLQKRLLECDVREFGKMLRMPPAAFDFVLDGIRPLITREDTNYRKSISAEERLSLTLKYLGTGESTASLAEVYRLGLCSVGRIIKDTCQAIFDVFGPEYIQTPQTPLDWQRVINGFDQRWNYPACLGAMDGKHIRIMKPWKSGSDYFNYKKFFSIVLFAIVNSNYEFLYVNVGSEGKCADGGIWKYSDLYSALRDNKLNLPPDIQLYGTNTKIACHFVADEAFAMSRRVLKKFPKMFVEDREAIFNYRISRARMVVENVFGICASKFRVLRSEINMNPDDAGKVVLAICTLHNLLRKHCGTAYIPANSVDHEDNNYVVHRGEWRNDEGNNLENLEATQSRNMTKNAKEMREHICDYFLTPYGEVEWQRRYIHNNYENFIANLANLPV